MKWWHVPTVALVLLACLALLGRAQQPGGLPTGGGSSPGGSTGAAGGGAGGGGGGCTVNCSPASKSCLDSLQQMCANMKKQCCNSPLGQFMSNALKPLSMMTGGIISCSCPNPLQPNPNDPANNSPAGSTANAIKQEEASAGARRAAVRYLATVDCHYYPEAELALIASLRADRNECVRWEAAKALGTGCCCTKKIVEALTIVVNASEKDGNPSENSMRVRIAACNSLQSCINCYGAKPPKEPMEPRRPEQPEMPMAPPNGPEPILRPMPMPNPDGPTRPEQPVAHNAPVNGKQGNVVQANYYTNVEKKPAADVLTAAKQAVAAFHTSPPAITAPPTGRRNLYDIWRNAENPGQVALNPVPGAAEPTLQPVPQGAVQAGSQMGPNAAVEQPNEQARWPVQSGEPTRAPETTPPPVAYGVWPGNPNPAAVREVGPPPRYPASPAPEQTRWPAQSADFNRMPYDAGRAAAQPSQDGRWPSQSTPAMPNPNHGPAPTPGLRTPDFRQPAPDWPGASAARPVAPASWGSPEPTSVSPSDVPAAHRRPFQSHLPEEYRRPLPEASRRTPPVYQEPSTGQFLGATSARPIPREISVQNPSFNGQYYQAAPYRNATMEEASRQWTDPNRPPQQNQPPLASPQDYRGDLPPYDSRRLY